MSQEKSGVLRYIVCCGGRPLCYHKVARHFPERLFYNGDITLFETLGEAKRAINNTVDACLQHQRDTPGCEVGEMATVGKYEIRHARLMWGRVP